MAITVDNRPFTVEITTTDLEVNLDPKRRYSVAHISRTTAGGASVAVVFIETIGTSVTADFTDGEGKLPAIPGGSFPLPGSLGKCFMATAADTAVVVIIPGDIKVSWT